MKYIFAFKCAWLLFHMWLFLSPLLCSGFFRQTAPSKKASRGNKFLKGQFEDRKRIPLKIFRTFFTQFFSSFMVGGAWRYIFLFSSLFDNCPYMMRWWSKFVARVGGGRSGSNYVEFSISKKISGPPIWTGLMSCDLDINSLSPNFSKEFRNTIRKLRVLYEGTILCFIRQSVDFVCLFFASPTHVFPFY